MSKETASNLEAKVNELRKQQSHDILEWICTLDDIEIAHYKDSATVWVNGERFTGTDTRDALAQACQALK